jgi:hypothetical protein
MIEPPAGEAITIGTVVGQRQEISLDIPDSVHPVQAIAILVFSVVMHVPG